MIEFKNGEFKGGETKGIVDYDFNDFSKDDLWRNPINENCWIFVIPNDDSKIGLFNAIESGIDFVPSKADISNEDYELFWCSELTMLFNSQEQALEFMRVYQGPLVDIIRGFYLLYERDNMIEEAMDGYMSINEINHQSDEHFYKQLSNFVKSKPLNPEIVITTMKSFILDWYRFEIAEQKFNN